MTEKEHLELIATLCGDIENCIRLIKLKSEFLKEFYGIALTDVSVLGGLSVHVYAGLELIANALKKKAAEYKRFPECNDKERGFVSRDVRWFQFPHRCGEKWLEANWNGNALWGLRAGGANNDKP